MELRFPMGLDGVEPTGQSVDLPLLHEGGAVPAGSLVAPVTEPQTDVRKCVFMKCIRYSQRKWIRRHRE
jgi:hypothetical protein